MQIEIFSLCDAATQQSGKLNILGAIDTVKSRKLPAVVPHCALALRIRFGLSEQGSHDVTVRFIDQDGHDLVPPITGNTTLTFSKDRTSISQNLILNIQGLTIKQPGEYAISLFIDNKPMATLPLYVIHNPPPSS